VALAACLAACHGCAELERAFVYSVDRLNDTGDMVDLGISVSWKRCFSLYACGLGLFTVGAGYFDGWFVGMGGGGFGIKRHYHKALGLIAYSYEESAWGTFDLNDRDTINRRHVGVLGWLFFPQPPGGASPS
jgi:hypothetical protein